MGEEEGRQRDITRSLLHDAPKRIALAIIGAFQVWLSSQVSEYRHMTVLSAYTNIINKKQHVLNPETLVKQS